MYRRLILIPLLAVLTACAPYSGGTYYRTEVYTAERYPSAGYYAYPRHYYQPPQPRYYVAPPAYYSPPPGAVYYQAPGPVYRVYPQHRPDPRWRHGPPRHYGHDRDRGGPRGGHRGWR